ncbi:MAG: GNAT family N-acetyltransferase [Leptospirales bacterium]|nr:GNAT family N-acetyltransferase [Leptospirales bacterium]
MPVQETPHEIYPLDLLLLADPEESVVRSYLSRSLCFTLNIENKIVGGYLLLPTRPGTMELVNIAVYEEYQRRGYARQLVSHSIAEAKTRGAKTIEVGTADSSFGPLALYRGAGFRLTGVDRDFFVRHYSEPVLDNGIQCRDMLRLTLDLD